MPATVLPFPTPVRSILQPSLHARGGRPYAFQGRMDDWHAPGAAYKAPHTVCAADAAWLVERVLGKPDRSAAMWPGVPGAAERARDYGQRVGLYAYQQDGAAFLAERDYALLADQMGTGKAQPLDVKILTPTGWRLMGDLVVGDAVINSAGTTSRVVGVYPQGVRPTFRVTFSDGASTECCDEHLWSVNTPYRKWAGYEPRVKPLSEIRQRLRDGAGNLQHFVPLVPSTVDLGPPIGAGDVNPYLLGQLLGDGSLSGNSVVLTTSDQETVDRVATMLPRGVSVVHAGKIAWRLSGGKAGRANPLLNSLRRLGLHGTRSHTKFVPTQYLFTTVEHRLAVLRGLLDSDGHASKSGTVELISTSKQLAKDVVFLSRSLGATARIKPKKTPKRDAWRVTMSFPNAVPPFLLRRKAEAVVWRMKYPPVRAIAKVELVAAKPVQCIRVDAVDGLYVTDDFVVTHNTCQALIGAEARLSFGVVPSPTTPLVLILCPALAKRHWQREIKRWTGHDASVLEGLRAGELPSTRYVICNYDIIHGARRRDAAGVMHPHPELPGWGPSLASRFLVAICDESHMLRGKSSQRLKAVAKLCKSVPVVWMLSGTPMPNYVRDLWSQIDLMSGGLLGPYWPFARRYCDAHQAKYGWVDTGSSDLEELSARLAFFMLGRSASAVALELPEKRRELFKVDVEMTAPTVREAHEALSRGNAVARALRATAKAKRPMVVAQAVEALQAKQKVVVFTYHREQADAVAKAIKAQVECTLLCVHGDLSPDGRDAQATVFRDAASPACFVATIDSVGMAISLVGADLVLFGDLLYEPWKLLQAEKRCHRHGSTCRVLVRYLVAIGTIDEALAETVIAKLANIEDALGADPEAGGLSGLLVEDPKTTTEIVDALFEKLRSWGAQA